MMVLLRLPAFLCAEMTELGGGKKSTSPVLSNYKASEGLQDT